MAVRQQAARYCMFNGRTGIDIGLQSAVCIRVEDLRCISIPSLELSQSWHCLLSYALTVSSLSAKKKPRRNVQVRLWGAGITDHSWIRFTSEIFAEVMDRRGSYGCGVALICDTLSSLWAVCEFLGTSILPPSLTRLPRNPGQTGLTVPCPSKTFVQPKKRRLTVAKKYSSSSCSRPEAEIPTIPLTASPVVSYVPVSGAKYQVK